MIKQNCIMVVYPEDLFVVPLLFPENSGTHLSNIMLGGCESKLAIQLYISHSPVVKIYT